MKKLIKKDKNIRRIIRKYESTRTILKSITKNTNFANTIRWNAALMLNNLPKDSCKTRAVNRCLLTGRNAKLNKSYRFSRLAFLRLVRFGNISGFRKATW